MKLIGVNGLKTSGKDTVFQYVKEYADAQGEQAVRRAFADKLKRMAALALGFSEAEHDLIALMDECKDKWIIDVSRISNGQTSADLHIAREPIKELTGRQYLQWFGGNARKVFGDSFWIDQVLPNPATDPYAFDPLSEQIFRDKVARSFFGGDYGVITDVRYPNEALRVRDCGGLMLQVIRPGLVSDGHDSEQALTEGIDYIINNDGTLRDLQAKVEAFLETL